MSQNAKSVLGMIAICLALVGAVSYLAIICVWIYWAWAFSSQGSVNWWEFRHAVAAPILLGIFIAAIVKRKSTRVRFSLIVIALAIMICWSFYDCYHRNYQIGTHSLKYGWDNYHVLGKGATHHYINWPWMTYLESSLPCKAKQSSPGTETDALTNYAKSIEIAANKAKELGYSLEDMTMEVTAKQNAFVVYFAPKATSPQIAILGGDLTITLDAKTEQILSIERGQ